MAYFFSIRGSKLNYTCNVVPYVLMIELMKMVISIALKYCVDGEFIPKTLLFSSSRNEIWRRGLLYIIPAFLYAVYNNMTFINIDVFFLSTYQVFMQTRVWFTGIMSTLILGRALSMRKWVALILLACGAALNLFSPTIGAEGWVHNVILQAFISSLVGVYNEYMFKSDPGLSIHMQNFFMYFYGIIFNALFGLVLVPDFIDELNIVIRDSYTFILIVLTGAAAGIAASFITNFTGVIVKAFASGVEVPLTAIMAAILLKEYLWMQDIVAIIIVTLAIYMFYTKGFGGSRLIRFNFRSRNWLSVVSEEMENN